jgi:general secretion pathway protein A
MYTSYFGLKEKPFSIAPNPRYLYMSEQHQDALAHLLYGLQEGDGFVLLTGDIGTGKTTLCRSLLEQIPDHVKVAYIFNPKLSALDLLLSICDEFKIALPNKDSPPSIKQVIDKINLYLLKQHAQGKQCVLIIDEAQNLGIDVLEQIRLLTNLETNSKKLLQIILIGQPELRTLFCKPEMEQLAQRITARYHIGPLSCKELENYLGHRIYIAGGSHRPLFNKGAIKELYKVTRGIPRLINTVADRALLAAYVGMQHEVVKKDIRKSAHELLDLTRSPRKISFLNTQTLFHLLVLISCLLVLTLILNDHLKLNPLSFLDRPVSQKDPTTYIIPNDARFNTETQHSALSVHPSRLDHAPEKTDTTPVELSNNQLLLDAQQAVLQRWGITATVTKNADFCVIAKENWLQCLQGEKTVDALIKLNHPAVVQLRGENGTSYHAALNEIKQGHAEIIVGTEIHSMTLAQLQQQWTGKFELLWRPPQHAQGVSANPDYHSIQTMEWFRTQLTLAQRNTMTNQAVYIAPVEKQIKQFQRESGLDPDGLIDPETIIVLTNLLKNSNSPLLTKTREAS